MRAILILMLASSCGNLKFVGNPAPNLKRVHMATEHWDYTEAEYEAHPDYDCKNPTKDESNNRRK